MRCFTISLLAMSLASSALAQRQIDLNNEGATATSFNESDSNADASTHALPASAAAFEAPNSCDMPTVILDGIACGFTTMSGVPPRFLG